MPIHIFRKTGASVKSATAISRRIRSFRIGTEACVALALILLALPAIGQAFRVVNCRVIAGLFLFIVLIAIARDPQIAARIAERLRSKRSHNHGI